MEGRIFDIKRFAIHDGPGIRTTVFLKGCPLACVWCHNPEGMRTQPEMIVHPERCVQCGSCLRAFAAKAIRATDQGMVIDRALCNLSLACEAQCPTRAIQRAWRDVTDEELAEELARDQLFFRDGGGVTLSGGDPLNQPEFALSVLEKLKRRGINTCMETSMMASADVAHALPAVLDHLLADIKIMDEAAHVRFTGASNVQILDNFRYLAQTVQNVTVRVPLIPGITATDENLTAIAQFVQSVNPNIPIELINFNSLAASKYAMMGEHYFDEDMRALPAEELDRLNRLVADARVQGGSA